MPTRSFAELCHRNVFEHVWRLGAIVPYCDVAFSETWRFGLHGKIL